MSTSSGPGFVAVRKLANGNVYEVIAADLKAPVRAASRKAPNACASPFTNKSNIHQLLGFSEGLMGKATTLLMRAAEWRFAKALKASAP